MSLDPREQSKDPTVEPRWFDVDAASRYLCMSVHALYHRIGRRQIPFVKHGRMIRFDRFALDRWMAKGVRHGFDETTSTSCRRSSATRASR
jgi:excisionase family DNA binding protein